MLKQDFNKKWTVKKEVTNMVEAFMGGGEPPKEIEVTLPHDAMIFEKRKAGNPSGPAYGNFEGGDYEYKKTFPVAAEDCGKTFIVEFEGIFNRSRIYVNGTQAAATKYGYTGEFVDITPYLHFGADNQIVVKVVNSDLPVSRWYTGSGLYRPVWLYTAGDIRIEPNDLKVSTPDVAEAISSVQVKLGITYDGKVQKQIWVKTEILDADGAVINTQCDQVTLFPQDKTPVTRRMYVKNAKLWSPEAPNLYACKVTLVDGETELDSVCTTFGIRKLELNPVEGFKLNGKSVLLRGGCIHHDNGPVGAATFARAEERRIELLKEAGFNSVRVSHNSTSKALLDACDRLGMLVMEESYDIWTQSKSQYDYALEFFDHWEKDVKEIVDKDFNHPSVFMYSIGNEIQNLHTQDGRIWSRKLTEKFRELDPTRYVTNAINGLMALMGDLPRILIDLGFLTPEQMQAMAAGQAANSEKGDGGINDVMTMLLGRMNDLAAHPMSEEVLKEAYETLDLVGLNYMRGVYDIMQKDMPNRVFYGSETLPPDIDLNWKKVKELPACVGDYTWTAWDYIGESGIGIVEYNKAPGFSKSYPAYIAYCGDIDITGFRRPISYFREIVFGLRKAPYIGVQPPVHFNDKAVTTPWVTEEVISTWTWNGFEGKPVRVEVYSDAPEVELFVNGKSVGKLPCGEDNRFKAVFETVYEPGEVKAVGIYADGSTEEFAIETAGKAVKVCAAADKAVVGKDDLVYINVALRDAENRVVTDADCKVSICAEGAGCVQGFGSGDPLSEENFFDAGRTTFYGRAVAVIRSGEEAGKICVKFEAEGLESKTVEIEVQ